MAYQVICNTEINYGELPGDVVIPFKFTLDTVNSVLNPGPGVNQKFCYIITGVGEDTSASPDLSHFILGICDTIPENQITNITVIINGVNQPISFGEGGNVQLIYPDPPTGYSRLKFDFGLNKDGGIMLICYELTNKYPVGPNLVCLAGEIESVTGLSICGPVCAEAQVCEAVGYQPATLCVPVTVTPFAIPGKTVTYCCGSPIVTPGTTPCEGVENGSCYFTLTQRICVAVPVSFGANTTIGSVCVDCDDASSEDICTDCT